MYNVEVENIVELWHKRLGHPCNRVLTQVLQNCNVVFNKTKLSQVCSTCQLGKAHKFPFSPSQTAYSFPFELVVSDL